MEQTHALAFEERSNQLQELELKRLGGEIRKLIDHMHAFEKRFSEEIEKAHPQFGKSAANLVHYLALRQYDLRDLQQRLARVGLSSLGRTESHAMASIRAVSDVLDLASGAEPPPREGEIINFQESTELLASHADALFGSPPDGRMVRIMVTLPTEAAYDYYMVRDLVAAGMDIARINCGRDSEDVWRRMADHVDKARRETGRSCRLSMDLAGNKPRTGPLEPGPEVLRWKPVRDLRGRVTSPARVWLAPVDLAPPADRGRTISLPVDAAWLANVRLGDTLILTKNLEPGHAARHDAEGTIDEPARVACTLPDLLEDLRAGEPIRFDDGKIDGVITAVEECEVHVEITRAGEEGRKLRSERGINFPESHLRRTGMSAKDLEDLDLVFSRADMTGLSFVSKPDDIYMLHDELASHEIDEMGIVLKIETKEGFQQLPSLLLSAMQRYPFGVMIARGDLAVECGWERTAEIQEEILWLCEAAHVPVIWAT